jgi:hypothetical protein
LGLLFRATERCGESKALELSSGYFCSFGLRLAPNFGIRILPRRSRLSASVGPFRLGRRSVFIAHSSLVVPFGPAPTCNSAPLCQFSRPFRVSRCRSSSRVFTLATAVFGLLLRFLGLSSPSACALSPQSPALVPCL